MKNRISTKQRISCFQANLPTFLRAVENYKANQKQGRRPIKNEKCQG